MNTPEEAQLIKEISKFKFNNFGNDNHEFQVLANDWETQLLILRALRAILIRLGT